MRFRYGFWLWAMVAMIGVLSSYYYIHSYWNCETACVEAFQSVQAGNAVSPTRYRVLAPALAGMFMPDQTANGIGVGYKLAHLVTLPIMMLVLAAWVGAALRTALAGLVAALVTAVYLPLMFEIWGGSLYAALEVIWLCLACLVLLRWRGGWQHIAYGVLVVIATLTRETGMLLVILFAATYGVMQREERIWTVIYAALWVGVYGGLRLALGPAPDMLTVQQTWAANTSSWVTAAAVTNQFFFLPVWGSAVAGWFAAKRLPDGVLLQRLCWAIPVYVGLLAVFSLWNEVRLLLPVMAIVLPLAGAVWMRDVSKRYDQFPKI